MQTRIESTHEVNNKLIFSFEKFKWLLFLVVVLVAIVLIALFLQFKNKSSHLNLIIISIDTLRPDHMGIYGYQKETTPYIDKWAQNATVFSDVTTMVPMTHASFSILFNGRDPFETRIVSNSDDHPSVGNKTLATRLSEYGYRTSAFVTNEPGYNQGFDDYKFHLFKHFYLTEDKKEQYVENNRFEYESFIASSLDWITQHKKEKFFTWIHLMDPHAPYFPAPDLRCKFNAELCPIIENKSVDEIEEMRSEYQMCQNSQVPKERVEAMEALYDGSIATADRLVGKILAGLEEEGLDKNTIVILYGDHGEGFDHNYFFTHREVLYDSAVKIPLIIKHPLIKGGNRSMVRVQNLDILPSILDLLQIKDQEPRLMGNSFAGVFNPSPFNLNKANNLRDFYFINSTWTKFAVSNGEYKYIYSLPKSCLKNGELEELYNLKSDPAETHNLVKVDVHLAKSFKKRLLEHLAKYNLPYTEPHFTEDSGRQDALRSIQY